MDQTTVPKRKFSRPKTGADKVQGLEWGLYVTERGLFAFQSRCKTSTASVFIIFKIKKGEDKEIYGRELLNSEELEELEELEGLDVDLRSRKGETHRCKVAAEGCRVLSGPTRLMQRPELVKTGRSAVAAVELEWQGGGKRKKTTGRRRMGDLGRAYL